MDLGFEGHVALVTGSSQGIGRATALQFAREGARVVITYRNHRDKAEAVADEIRNAGSDALVTVFDLASDESIQAAIDSVLTRWGRIDTLVNNAVAWGPQTPAEAPPFEQLSPEDWRPLLRTNIEGAFRTTQVVAAAMRERRWGRIVNISTGLAVDGIPGSSWYASAKAGLHGLTRTLYKELGPDGILTNVVMPGFTLTERADEMPTKIREEYAHSSPIRRILRPHEVARIILFLGSPANTAVNGEIIRASGGNT